MDLSDDGRTLLFQEWGEGGGANGSVYLRRMDGSAPVRLGDGFALSLSPDGQWVLARLYTRPPRLVLLPTGAGEARPLSTEGILVQSAAWFSDGKRILLLGSAQGREPAYYTLDVGDGKARPVAPAADYTPVWRPLISPDGRLLPRMNKDKRLSLLSLEGGESRLAAGVEPGEFPLRWSPDGRFLFVVREQGPRRIISRVDPFGGQREPWKAIPPPDPVGVSAIDWLSVTPDGAGYVYSFVRRQTDLYVVEGLK